ncbi:GNAT family N-acetyltransferase [Curtobacterium sp. VKM Ac-1376]|uniref:GNAT family N-acetyltransferase n=1 Tax=Curtobacterium sp. VKM Ac-1376 TaxID=123312 RepID=UPI00188B790E|nr:GNAT family N-acetyltransferase [Curtobacterium sp. VKM Ac-1376]MBF4615086.1 GNAT family N-acetyltransferase [Curtobacterium sp. VKM Ac-1376]
MPQATSTVTIADLATPADADAFRALNEAWITRFFTLEDEDRVFLGDPVGRVVERGGAVLVARLDDRVIGCIGVVPTTPGVFELVKMAVSPDHQGHGTGRKLITAALDRARELGARRIDLESNAQLASAVHLYESFGFRHLREDELIPSPYVRADVHMTLDLH